MTTLKLRRNSFTLGSCLARSVSVVGFAPSGNSKIRTIRPLPRKSVFLVAPRALAILSPDSGLFRSVSNSSSLPAFALNVKATSILYDLGYASLNGLLLQVLVTWLDNNWVHRLLFLQAIQVGSIALCSQRLKSRHFLHHAQVSALISNARTEIIIWFTT
jgi:hypothetical protein